MVLHVCSLGLLPFVFLFRNYLLHLLSLKKLLAIELAVIIMSSIVIVMDFSAKGFHISMSLTSVVLPSGMPFEELHRLLEHKEIL